MGNIRAQMAYSATVRTRMAEMGQQNQLTALVPLPGLSDVNSQIGIPLLLKERLRAERAPGGGATASGERDGAQPPAQNGARARVDAAPVRAALMAAPDGAHHRRHGAMGRFAPVFGRGVTEARASRTGHRI